MKLKLKILTNGWKKMQMMKLKFIEASGHPTQTVWLHMDIHIASKTWNVPRQGQKINFNLIMGHNGPNSERY